MSEENTPIEYVGNELTPAKKRKVVTEDQARNALDRAGISKNITTVRQLAREQFGQWQAAQGFAPMLITSNMHYLEQATKACEVGIAMMDDKYIPPETKVKAGLMVVQAVKAATEMSKVLQALADSCGALKPAQTPQNAPPNFLIKAEGDVHLHEKTE